MRRIALVDLPWRHPGDDRPSLGHASLLASLRSDSQIDVCSITAPINDPQFSVEDVAQRVLDAAKGVAAQNADIAIGVYVWNDGAVGNLINQLRQNGFDGRIILGGPQITYAERGIDTKYPEADAFIRGQAESALRQMAKKCGEPRICGVHYAGNEDRVEQTQSPFADAPSPWLNCTRQLTSTSRITWESQRGCPFRCAFCQHRQPGNKTPVAMATQNRIDAEIDLFCRLDVSRISVVDPVFNLYQDHAIRVLDRFGSLGFKGNLSIQCRAELITPEFLNTARKLDVCLEFGLQSIHPRELLAVGRPNNMARAEAALRAVGQLGIRYEVSLIYGLPEQTMDSFASSIRWCESIGVPVIKAYPLLLLRGTALEKNRGTWGLEVAPGDLPIVIRSNSFDSEHWQAMDRLASITNARHEPGIHRSIAWSETEASCRDDLANARHSALGKNL